MGPKVKGKLNHKGPVLDFGKAPEEDETMNDDRQINLADSEDSDSSDTAAVDLIFNNNFSKPIEAAKIEKKENIKEQKLDSKSSKSSIDDSDDSSESESDDNNPVLPWADKAK